MLLHPSQQKALGLVPGIVAALSDFDGNGQESAMKLVDERLIQGGDEADKLVGSAIRAYLRLSPLSRSEEYQRQRSERYQQELERFIRADYTVVNCFDSRTDRYFEGKLDFYSSSYDGWSLSKLITNELSSGKQPLASLADAAGKWIAFFLSDEPRNINVLQEECSHAGITPFKNIDVIEFAGVDGLTNSALNKLFARCKVTAPTDDWTIPVNDPKFVSLKSPGELAALKPRNIMAKNVFAGYATSGNGYYNGANLLCVMANALPDGGRIYVANTFNDHINFTRPKDESLLKLAGLKIFGQAELSDNPILGGGCYVLERDYKIRDASPVTQEEHDRWWHSRHIRNTPPSSPNSPERVR